MYIATCIEWDTDGDDEIAASLPDSIKLPDDIDPYDEDAVGDFLSDETGFCVFGYVLERGDN